MVRSGREVELDRTSQGDESTGGAHQAIISTKKPKQKNRMVGVRGRVTSGKHSADGGRSRFAMASSEKIANAFPQERACASKKIKKKKKKWLLGKDSKKKRF